MRIMLLLTALAFVAAVAIAADYCGENKTVYIGDTSGEVILKCGEPDRKQSHTEEVIATLDNDKKSNILITLEEWTYNLGPERFMRIFKLQDGKVVDMWLGDYGFAKEQVNRPQCSALSISVGDSAAEVAAKCGEPTLKDQLEEITQEQLDANTSRKVYGTVEHWTYNFGPNQFLRILTIRNGKVTNIEEGDYGYEVKPKEEKR